MLISSQMPDLKRYQRPEQQIDALYQYVFTLRNQINHVLSNLDAENLGQELSTTLSNIQRSVTEAVQKPAQQSVQAFCEAWPVGAVYLTADAAQEPAELFGGAWEQMTSPMDGLYAWQRKE